MYVFTKGDKVVAITSESTGMPEYEKTYDMPDFQKVLIGDTVVDGVVTNVLGIPSFCLSKLEFMNRFTLSELAGIEVAAAADPIVKVLQRQQEIADFIDLEDAKTAQGIGYLVTIGLLTPERMNEILVVVNN
jgi:hypothetical protein